MKTRVYAIAETGQAHEISNEDFINQAEELGYCWSLLGFQNELNREGNPTLSYKDGIYINGLTGLPKQEFAFLHFRFIDVEVSK